MCFAVAAPISVGDARGRTVRLEVRKIAVLVDPERCSWRWALREVVCKLSNEASDVRCSVCGQGFLVYWARFSRAEQVESRRVIQEALREHHAGAAADVVHPRESFTVVDTVMDMAEYADAAQSV
jgi:hypothetical protein